MLQIRNLSHSFSDRVLLREVAWTISPGKRVALVGANGAGKTTLLKILCSEIPVQGGEIICSKKYAIGYLPQEEVAVGNGPVLEEVLLGRPEIQACDREILKIRASLDTAKNDAALLNRLGELEHRFEILGGYTCRADAQKILAGLGFSEGDQDRPLKEFSGGWRMRVYLARLLLQKPDLLLLDEPNNHLDLESLEWLEAYLLSFTGSIIIVSHDRYFIDRLAQEIVELDGGNLKKYTGNYRRYEEQREQDIEQLRHRAEQLREERERLTKFIERFRYKASKAVQVQSRVKMLEKLEKVEIPPPRKTVSFQIKCPVKSYHEVAVLREVAFRYSLEWVFENIDLTIYRGEKTALVGRNGAGKTTLTRLLAGQLDTIRGEYKQGEQVQIGYYAQHQIDVLNENNTVYEEVEQAAADENRRHVRDVLGVFQFSGDDVDKKIKVLSGGEKARVSLAKILISPVNFLIMDEPTNHLDLSAREALEKALADYDGTVLLISHDRYFLDKLVRRVFELQDGQMRHFEGNYSDYLRKKSKTMAEIPTENEAVNIENRDKKTRKREEAELRQKFSVQRRQLTEQIRDAEQRIEQLETEQNLIETAMADPGFYKNEEESGRKIKSYRAIKEEIAQHYTAWEKASAELERLIELLPQKPQSRTDHN